jgi:TATA-box binding protein (TBP) (component of TFIID and TFIIIB)
MKFRFVGSHAEDLASGQIVAPGEFINLSADEVDDPHNATLIADGKLLGTGAKSRKEVEEKGGDQ